ncbi:UDP-glucose 4-epimerase GalE [Hyphobacterium sp.]|uniref:UDP-glucose 4-epimerase GalE n=1 Tax=Hyphobacterium sp. TaxID=2004662 RepID=UPI003748BEA5
MKILVLGGAGYIGSHVCKALAARGDTPVVFDNLSTGHRTFVQWGDLAEGDIRDASSLDDAFALHKPDAAMHFAASIEVGIGEREPLAFWQNNVAGTLNVLESMARHDCVHFVFSSTCAVYGQPDRLPIREEEPRKAGNVYGRTKLAVERILEDVSAASPLRFAALRYFNAAGASPEAEIGEKHDPETHLIPNALKAAAGVIERFHLFGDDYQTRDGTCVRDFIHVEDLAAGHLAALDRLVAGHQSFACNLGTGQGTTVKEIISAVETITGKPVPLDIHPRRPGDAAKLYADNGKARDLLGFNPARSDIQTIVEDAWRFHQRDWAL